MALYYAVVANVVSLRENLFGKRVVAYCLIAEYQNQIAGFALYFYNFSTFLGKPGIYLEDLFVKENYRGLGIGKQLIQSLVNLAQQEDLGRVEWSVLDWNTPSIEFYNRLGAVALDDWITYRLTSDKFQSVIQS